MGVTNHLLSGMILQVGDMGQFQEGKYIRFFSLKTPLVIPRKEHPAVRNIQCGGDFKDVFSEEMIQRFNFDYFAYFSQWWGGKSAN